jgi:uncharacterized membrane protein YfcA
VLEHLLQLLLGAAAGLVGAPRGLGAAPFIAPLLVFGYHLPMGQALGTALAIGFLTGASGATALLQSYPVDLRAIQPLAWAGIAGTVVSSQFLSPPSRARFPLLVGLLLIGGLAYVLSRQGWARLSASAQRRAGRSPHTPPSVADSRAWWIKASIPALFAGGVSTSLGVGAGLVFVPFLAGEPCWAWSLAVATAQVADVPVTFTGSLWFLQHGQLNFPLVVYLGAGGMVGAQLGVRVIARCRPLVWELAYGLTCLSLGAFLVGLARPALLPLWLVHLLLARGLERAVLQLPGWVGLLIGTTTGAAALFAIHLVRTLWKRRDLMGGGCAALGLAAFLADFAAGLSHSSLHRRGAYAVAAVYLLNFLYVIVKGDRVAVVLVAVGTGLLLAGIGLARFYFGGPFW